MSLYKKIMVSLRGGKHEYVPILIRQTEYLCKTTTLLAEVFGSVDPDLWARNEKEIKSWKIPL